MRVVEAALMKKDGHTQVGYRVDRALTRPGHKAPTKLYAGRMRSARICLAVPPLTLVREIADKPYDARGSRKSKGLGRQQAEQAKKITEAELAWIWEGQRQPPEALALGDGSVVPVVYPGRRAGGAGPDFRDAVVRVRGKDVLGDVELHVRASSFAGHGHGRDPAYNNLALHVAFVDDAGGSVRLASGRTVETAALAPWVERRQASVAAWLGGGALWQEPCQTAAARLGDDGIDHALAAAGRARFAMRTAAMAGRMAERGAETALWAALLDALGYGGDRKGFGRLAHAVTPAMLHPYLTLGGREGVEDVLLAVAGLRDAWSVGLLPAAPLLPTLMAGRGRSANHPARRLAAAAALFARAAGDLAAYARESVAGSPSELISAWSVGAPSQGGGALVGSDRAAEIAVNAVLPFVAASMPALSERCLELLAELKASPAYGKNAFLERNLKRSDGTRRVRSALKQQGLLALHREWCSQGGCGHCPLSPEPAAQG